MNAPLFSRLPFADRNARGRIEYRRNPAPVIRSQAFDWPGVLLESGRNDVAAVEGVALAHHYIGLMTDLDPVSLRDVKGPSGRHDIMLPPGSLWVLPAGDEATLRLEAPFSYIRMTIDPRLLARVLTDTTSDGTGIELRRTYAIHSPQLRHLLMTLIAEADARNPGGLAFVETLIAAIGRQLAVHAAVTPSRPEPARGGLSPASRRRVLELIDAKLDARLSIETLAREAGMSPAHFARAFKQTLGEPPHRFLLTQRLDRARRLLERPDTQLSDVALRSGFADQAHFTRHFKRRFGITPGALTRSRRSGS